MASIYGRAPLLSFRNIISRISTTNTIFARWSIYSADLPGCSMFYSIQSKNRRFNLLNVQNYDHLIYNEVFRTAKRSYGGKPPNSIKTITDRVMLVLQLYDKINPEKIKLDSHFINDLGLDSLDHVEIMLQLEHEFVIEIPDADAERLMTPRDIIQYICDLEDVYH